MVKSALSRTFDLGVSNHIKPKGAYLRKPWSGHQIATAYRYLTDPVYGVWTEVSIYSYGGRVNTVSPVATAVPQRDSILRCVLWAYWTDHSEESRNLAWLRDFYRDLYAATGGVPMPGDATDGAAIGYPDADLADPRWNTSGVPWHTLYYKDSYPRLQRVKARWDPRNIFNHALSIRLLD